MSWSLRLVKGVKSSDYVNNTEEGTASRLGNRNLRKGRRSKAFGEKREGKAGGEKGGSGESEIRRGG